MNAVHQPIPPAFTNEVYDALERFDRRIYFRWDLVQDILKLESINTGTVYGLPAHLNAASTKLWGSDLIHPDDLTLLHTYLHTIFHHAPRYTNRTRNLSCKLRLRGRKQDDYIWSDIHIVTYFNGHKPAAAFGSIRNIQAQKLWQERIEREASCDKLTGLLNKDAARKRIHHTLKALSPQTDNAALLLIDADGFKTINDSFGHLFGDAVLKDMGHAISHHFSQFDIQGRIGGDEFAVFLHDAADIDRIKAHCEQLIASLSRKYRNGSTSLPFSISIGIAQYPAHGTTYAELFKHADRALYEAKSQGCSRYHFYQMSLFDTTLINQRRNPASFADLQQKAFKDNMIEFIFMLLYETNSPEATIELSLGMFGRRFNLDRVSLDHFDHDTSQYINRFEWVSPQGFSLQQQNHETDISDLVTTHHNLILGQYKPTPYGVMSVCPDTSQLTSVYQPAIQKMRFGAFAHCLISHGSATLGCVGFESAQPHEFSQEIINSLSIFAVILGNILLPHDSDTKIKQENQRLREILNHMQEMVYIIDKTTMMPIYYNQTIRQILPCVASHRPCYQQFHHRDTPCPDCPVQKLTDGSEYIEADLDNWIASTPSHTRACNLSWHGKDDHPLALVVQEPL